MAGSLPGAIKAEPNLTPLLDVVLQLIMFFMICVNFSQDNYDSRIRLPVAGSAKPVEGRPDEDRLTLNINKDGKLVGFGAEPLGTEMAIREIEKQARLTRLNLEFGGKKLKPGDPLPTILVIRADRATQFAPVFRIITACQANGFQKYALKAMNSGG